MIGGGNSGLEEGLFLRQFAERIRVVEFMPELKASARRRVRSDPRFTVHVNTQITGFERSEGGKLAKVRANPLSSVVGWILVRSIVRKHYRMMSSLATASVIFGQIRSRPGSPSSYRDRGGFRRSN